MNVSRANQGYRSRAQREETTRGANIERVKRKDVFRAQRDLPFPSALFRARADNLPTDDTCPVPASLGVNPPPDVDLVITLGGDGTILHVSSLYSRAGKVPPVVSFSMGSLGFLLPFRRSFPLPPSPPPSSCSRFPSHSEWLNR